MILIYVYLAAATMLAVAASLHLVLPRVAQSTPWLRTKAPRWTNYVFLFVGILGMAATIPGIFFDQPNWLNDRIFGVIAKVL